MWRISGFGFRVQGIFGFVACRVKGLELLDGFRVFRVRGFRALGLWVAPGYSGFFPEIKTLEA